MKMAQNYDEDYNFSTTRRLSILKPPVRREPLQDITMQPTSNYEEDMTTTTKSIRRRVSFAGKNVVKEFMSAAETIHILNTPAYEETFACVSSDSSHMTNSCGFSDASNASQSAARNRMSLDRSQLVTVNSVDMTMCSEVSGRTSISSNCSRPSLGGMTLMSTGMEEATIYNAAIFTDSKMDLDDSHNDSDNCQLILSNNQEISEVSMDELRLSETRNSEPVSAVNNESLNTSNMSFTKVIFSAPDGEEFSNMSNMGSTSSTCMSFTKAVPNFLSSSDITHKNNNSSMSFTKVVQANTGESNRESMSFTKVVSQPGIGEKTTSDLSMSFTKAVPQKISNNDSLSVNENSSMSFTRAVPQIGKPANNTSMSFTNILQRMDNTLSNMNSNSSVSFAKRLPQLNNTDIAENTCMKENNASMSFTKGLQCNNNILNKHKNSSMSFTNAISRLDNTEMTRSNSKMSSTDPQIAASDDFLIKNQTGAMSFSKTMLQPYDAKTISNNAGTIFTKNSQMIANDPVLNMSLSESMSFTKLVPQLNNTDIVEKNINMSLPRDLQSKINISNMHRNSNMSFTKAIHTGNNGVLNNSEPGSMSFTKVVPYLEDEDMNLIDTSISFTSSQIQEAEMVLNNASISLTKAVPEVMSKNESVIDQYRPHTFPKTVPLMQNREFVLNNESLKNAVPEVLSNSTSVMDQSRPQSFPKTVPQLQNTEMVLSDASISLKKAVPEVISNNESVMDRSRPLSKTPRFLSSQLRNTETISDDNSMSLTSSVQQFINNDKSITDHSRSPSFPKSVSLSHDADIISNDASMSFTKSASEVISNDKSVTDQFRYPGFPKNIPRLHDAEIVLKDASMSLMKAVPEAVNNKACDTDQFKAQCVPKADLQIQNTEIMSKDASMIKPVLGEVNIDESGMDQAESQIFPRTVQRLLDSEVMSKDTGIMKANQQIMDNCCEIEVDNDNRVVENLTVENIEMQVEKTTPPEIFTPNKCVLVEEFCMETNTSCRNISSKTVNDIEKETLARGFHNKKINKGSKERSLQVENDSGNEDQRLTNILSDINETTKNISIGEHSLNRRSMTNNDENKQLYSQAGSKLLSDNKSQESNTLTDYSSSFFKTIDSVKQNTESIKGKCEEQFRSTHDERKCETPVDSMIIEETSTSDDLTSSHKQQTDLSAKASLPCKRKSDSIELEKEEFEDVGSPSKIARLELIDSNVPAITSEENVEGEFIIHNSRRDLMDETASNIDSPFTTSDCISGRTSCSRMDLSGFDDSFSLSENSKVHGYFDRFKDESCFTFKELDVGKFLWSFFSEALELAISVVPESETIDSAQFIFNKRAHNRIKSQVYNRIFAKKTLHKFGKKIADCKTVKQMSDFLEDLINYMKENEQFFKEIACLFNNFPLQLDNTGRLIYDAIDGINRLWFTVSVSIDIMWRAVPDDSLIITPVIGKVRDSDVRHLLRCANSSANRLKHFIHLLEEFVKKPPTLYGSES